MPQDQHVAIHLAVVAGLVHETRIADDDLPVHPVASVLADLDPAFALGHVHAEVRRLNEVAVVGVGGDSSLRILTSEEDLQSRGSDIHQYFMRAGEDFDVAFLPDASILEHERAPVWPVRHGLLQCSLGPDAVTPDQHGSWILHGQRKLFPDDLGVFLQCLEPFVLAVIHIRERNRGQSLHEAPSPLHALAGVHLHKLLAPTKPPEAVEHARCLAAKHVDKRRLNLSAESDLLGLARQRRYLGKLGASCWLDLQGGGDRRLARSLGAALCLLAFPSGKVVRRTVPEHVLRVPGNLVLPVRQHVPEVTARLEDDLTTRALASLVAEHVVAPHQMRVAVPPQGDGRAAREGLREPSHFMLLNATPKKRGQCADG